MVAQLDGMFAFALVHGDRFLLARDPLGIKPLYWGRSGADGATLYFASEMRALLGACDEVWEFPNGRFYSGSLEEVRTGRVIEAARNGTGLQPYCYLRPSPEEIPEDRVGPALAGLGQRLRRAVEKRLMADVPLGVFLSGGLDSSLIAAIAREMIPGDLHSFAVGMKGSEDLAYSRQVADHLGTIHHTYEYTPEEVVESLSAVIYHLESYDPALVRSAIPTYFVSRLAARWVKVVLSGEGADELFAGYEYLRRPEVSDINRECALITFALHNTNLQRVDRLTMAHSIEGRVPFLDVDVVRYGLRLAAELKLARTGSRELVEKWILRRVAESYLPSNVVWRHKEKFAHGTGTSDVLSAWARRRLAGRRSEAAAAGSSAEEVLYRDIFRRHFPHPAAERLVGKTRSVVPGEIA